MRDFPRTIILITEIFDDPPLVIDLLKYGAAAGWIKRDAEDQVGQALFAGNFISVIGRIVMDESSHLHKHRNFFEIECV